MVRHPRRGAGRYGDLRLVQFPSVVVQVECPWCTHRRGRYRLARLAAQYGPEILLDDLLESITKGCPFHRSAWERPPGKYEPRCGARFPALESRR